MAKMGDLFINITTAGDDGGEWMSVGKAEFLPDPVLGPKPEPTADLSQIKADLEKLPKALSEIQPYQQKFLSQMPPLNGLSYHAAKKWAAQMYGVPGKLIEEPTPEVVALRKALDVLEKKLAEMQYGQSQTVAVPIYIPPTSVVYDPVIPPKLSIKTLTVTIRLEE